MLKRIRLCSGCHKVAPDSHISRCDLLPANSTGRTYVAERLRGRYAAVTLTDDNSTVQHCQTAGVVRAESSYDT